MSTWGLIPSILYKLCRVPITPGLGGERWLASWSSLTSQPSNSTRDPPQKQRRVRKEETLHYGLHTHVHSQVFSFTVHILRKRELWHIQEKQNEWQQQQRSPWLNCWLCTTLLTAIGLKGYFLARASYTRHLFVYVYAINKQQASRQALSYSSTLLSFNF